MLPPEVERDLVAARGRHGQSRQQQADRQRDHGPGDFGQAGVDLSSGATGSDSTRGETGQLAKKWTKQAMESEGEEKGGKGFKLPW